MDLAHVMELVCAKWQFNAETYPELQGVTEEEAIRKFAIRHVALHQMKSLCKAAAFSEVSDHGGELDSKELEELAVKMLVNTLRLADLIGLTPESFDTLIEDWAAGGVRYVQHEEPHTGEPLYRSVDSQL